MEVKRKISKKIKGGDISKLTSTIPEDNDENVIEEL
jgi:hypothetical protein